MPADQRQPELPANGGWRGTVTQIMAAVAEFFTKPSHDVVLTLGVEKFIFRGATPAHYFAT